MKLEFENFSLMKKVILIIAYILLVSAVFGQTKSDLQFIEQTLDQRGEIVLKFQHNGNRELVNELGQILSIDKVTSTYVEAYANRAEYEQFKTYGIAYEPLYEYYTQTRAITMATTVAQMANWDRYPTYAVYLEMMHNYAINYPTLCKMDTVGYSVNNRPIITMVISDNIGTDEDEPEFWWSSTMHGDETTGWYFMIRLVDYLLTNYNTDAQVTNLVNNMEIYISPLTNPDGTFSGSSNGTSIANATRANANNVDLNRNFPPISGTVSSGNQPEITMMTAYASAHHFVMAANGHGGTECLNYPWDQQNWFSYSHPHPDTDWWEYICQQYAGTCHALNSSYLTGPGSMYDNSNNSTGITEGCDWYYTQGGRQDYMNYYHHCREITMEWSNTKKLDCEYLNTYWGYNRQALLDYTEQALYGFRGIVTDACTNQPLNDVKVFINDHDADNSEVYTAAPVGDYHRPIYAGTYSVTFSKDGYVSKTFTVTTQNMASVRLDVSLCPEPSFTTNPPVAYEGRSIQFNNTLEACTTSTSWTFEGASPATSTAASPTVIYNAPGTYNVSLSTVSDNGCSSSTTGQITVYEAIPPEADFSASETIVSIGNAVDFTDLSTNMPTSWQWTFEGGNPATSNVQNPTVTYNEPGIYTVTLVATNDFGSDTETKTAYIEVASVIDMSNETIYACSGTYRDPGGDGNYENNARYTQTIYPSSEGAYVRLSFTQLGLQQTTNWGTTCNDYITIYDGTSTSATQIGQYCGTNPSSIGTNGVVTATNSDGALTIYFYSNNGTVNTGWEAEISCYQPEPVAEFSAAIAESCTRNINITNESEYATSYLWAFGDGTTSTEAEPTHTYAANGTYTITLTATNAIGNSTATQQIEIEIPEITSVTPANGCANTNLTLSATGTGTFHWFDAATGGTELGTGESYSANFTETTTFYVEAQQGSEQYYNVGVTDNTASTAYTNNGQNRGLTFTVSQNLTLVSVDIYCSQNNQSKTITISNSSNQQVYSQAHTLTSGLNTLTLNVELEPGTYNIYANSVRYTYRQNGSFPYSVENVISITGSYNATGNYYYTFYNWVVKTGSSCTSERTAVTATVIESGNINLGEPIVQCGGTATIDAGSGFDSYIWSNQQTTQSITVAQSGTYTVTASNGACEVEGSVVVTINPVPSVTISENINTLTANTTSGTGNYQYAWSTNENAQSITIDSNGNYCVTVTDSNNCSVSECSNITLPDIDINISNAEHGNIDGENSVAFGENYTFTVIPDACYQIGTVTVNGNVVILDENNSYTIQNVTTEQTINATFTQIRYTITASAGNGGSITPSGNVNVACGESQTFDIAENEGYIISDVLVDGQSVGTQSSYTFSDIDSNHTISATFEVIPAGEIVININADTEGGSISPSDTQTITEGSNFTFSVTPDDCYEIGDVTVNGTEITLDENNSYTINNVTTEQTINVTFNRITYTITASAGNGGTITPYGNVEVNCGESKTFIIEANEGYEIENVVVDGQNQGAITSYTFENVTEAGHSIEATFNEIIVVPECNAATNLTAQVESYGVVLTWNAAENAISYEIYRNGERISTETNTSAIDLQGHEGDTYYIITNCANGGTSDASETATAEAEAVCNAVTDLTARVESYGIVLSWNAAENAISYEIYRNGERISTETNTSSIDLQGSEGDTYYIITNCANGGTSDASETVTAIVTGICEIENKIDIFPNPALDVVEISAKETITHVEIVSLSGRIINETEVNEESVVINIENLSAGTYFVRIFCKSNTIIKKLIVM